MLWVVSETLEREPRGSLKLLFELTKAQTSICTTRSQLRGQHRCLVFLANIKLFGQPKPLVPLLNITTESGPSHQVRLMRTTTSMYLWSRFLRPLSTPCCLSDTTRT